MIKTSLTPKSATYPCLMESISDGSIFLINGTYGANSYSGMCLHSNDTDLEIGDILDCVAQSDMKFCKTGYIICLEQT